MKKTYLTIAGLLLSVAGLLWLKNKASKHNTTSTSYMNKSNYPRGYRNNNPLNIRLNANNNWQGKKTPNTDGAFEQFISIEYGYRAALYLLRKYITRDGLTTLSEIINKWAPAKENNTSGYINRVANITGWSKNKTINPNSQSEMCELAYAMAIVENGSTPLPNKTQIRSGWNLL